MSNDLLRLRLIVRFIIPFAVLLSVWSGTGSCLCPSSSRVVMNGIASCAFMNRPPHSASDADANTAYIFFAST